MTTNILIASAIINSLIVATFGVDERFCNRLKNNISNYDVVNTIRTLNDEYLRYTEVPKTSPQALETLTRKFEDCEIETAREIITRPYKDKPNKTEAVGVLDMRTVNQKVNIAIKVKHLKPCCTLLRPLLKIMKENSFNELYDPGQKIILYLFTYGFDREHVINEWIALSYQHGNIVDAQYHTPCLQKEDVRDATLLFNDKPLLLYFKDLVEQPEKPDED